MKESFRSILFAVLLVGFFSACTEDSSSAPEEPVDTFDAAVVCPAEGMNAYGEPNRGTFTDARDGQVYKYTTIGNQVWMAENLNYDAQGSICQGRDPSKCELYGRLYSYVGHVPDRTIDTINWNFIDSVCPNGWHLPTLTEWQILQSYMGEGAEVVASRLKSKEGWEKSNWGAGIDVCAFSALPGGSYSYEASGEGNSAFFLTATAEFEDMNIIVSFGRKIGFFSSPGRYSIRCLKN